MDGAILVAATDGPYSDPRAHPARPSGLCLYIVVFLNKCDMVDDDELIDLVEMETRELLSEYDFGDDILVIRGSALGASRATPVDGRYPRLMNAVDGYIPTLFVTTTSRSDGR
ncbi:MAG: GTP-binding protein [Collinsella sp.]